MFQQFSSLNLIFVYILAKVYAYLKNVLFVELFQNPKVLKMNVEQLVKLSLDEDNLDNNYEELFSLNKLLVSQNLAEFKVESELSHLLKIRKDANAQRRKEIKLSLGESPCESLFQMDVSCFS